MGCTEMLCKTGRSILPFIKFWFARHGSIPFKAEERNLLLVTNGIGRQSFAESAFTASASASVN